MAKTRKLTYWVADRIDDTRAYSVRGKTRKEVVAKLLADGCHLRGDEYVRGDDGYVCRWDKPHKVTVYYCDLVDLLTQALGEGGIE